MVTRKRHPAAYAAEHPGAGQPSPRRRSSPPCLSAVGWQTASRPGSPSSRIRWSVEPFRAADCLGRLPVLPFLL
ncbi:MAG: hypothetical protein ACK5WR_05935, partial [Planctomycetaceae bacterium]